VHVQCILYYMLSMLCMHFVVHKPLMGYIIVIISTGDEN
jgi:hypothetical protein